jgi:hypothetical protein
LAAETPELGVPEKNAVGEFSCQADGARHYHHTEVRQQCVPEHGERLFLFHRSVPSHLRRLFPRRGITSRTGLSAALSTITSDEEGRAPMPV